MSTGRAVIVPVVTPPLHLVSAQTRLRNASEEKEER